MNAPKKPVSIEAIAALLIALLAVGLGTFGVFNPWGTLSFPMPPKLSGQNALLCYGGTCLLPILLGILAALLGGHAYRKIEHANGAIGGDGQAFFSLMIGLFAVIIGACTSFVTLIWPIL